MDAVIEQSDNEQFKNPIKLPNPIPKELADLLPPYCLVRSDEKNPESGWVSPKITGLNALLESKWRQIPVRIL